MSRHHMLPPIQYTPVQKPKKAESRPRLRRLNKSSTGGVDDLSELDETADVQAPRAASAPNGTAATAMAGAMSDSDTVERKPGALGKLSNGTMKVLLDAQERENQR